MSDDLSAPTAEPDDDLGYAEALAELDDILAELEDGDVDIDRLADRVRRAATLLERCRGRIDEAELEVTRIVSDLAPDASLPPNGRGTPDSA